MPVSKEADELFFNSLQNFENQGWPFHIADPEIWRYRDRLLVPGGRALDLGIGYGRNSLPLALWGMPVIGYDLDQHAVDLMNKMAAERALTISSHVADVTKLDLSGQQFDTVLLSSLFIHFPNREQALEVFDKAIDALKPGGHLYLRALGKADDAYEQFLSMSKYNPYSYQQIDEDVLIAPCGCSGEMQLEPHLFFDQNELVQRGIQHDLRIVHSQTVPQTGAGNVMFGEDWQVESSPYKTNGMITMIGQKKETGSGEE
ncbi:MAG TPA: class I SAM-dependent methyltransferase [Patescibacteria group bacterium]|nr:class I SAM-dependent methyltransferase [Patescibacteria group bacterium]